MTKEYDPYADGCDYCGGEDHACDTCPEITSEEQYQEHKTEDHMPQYTREACEAEFGPHEHDDEECARILDEMENGADRAYEAYYGSLSDAINREAEENMLGRPLFPNEY